MLYLGVETLRGFFSSHSISLPSGLRKFKTEFYMYSKRNFPWYFLHYYMTHNPFLIKYTTILIHASYSPSASKPLKSSPYCHRVALNIECLPNTVRCFLTRAVWKDSSAEASQPNKPVVNKLTSFRMTSMPAKEAQKVDMHSALKAMNYILYYLWLLVDVLPSQPHPKT